MKKTQDYWMCKIPDANNKKRYQVVLDSLFRLRIEGIINDTEYYKAQARLVKKLTAAGLQLSEL